MLAERSYAAAVVVGEVLHTEPPVERILLEKVVDMTVAVVDAGHYCRSCRSRSDDLTG